VYCHIFVELPDENDFDDLDDGDLDAGDDDDDDKGGDSDDSDDMLGEKKAAAPGVGKRFDPDSPLPTPGYIKKIGFMRCNCTEGMPEGSMRFKPLEKRQYCGPIEIATWYKLQDAPPPEKMLTPDQEDALERKNKANYHLSYFLP